MAVYKLQKAKANAFVGEKFYTGAVNRLACGMDKYGYVTGLTKEQERAYEKELRLPEGELDRRNENYWGEQSIKVDAKGVILDEEQVEDAIKVAFLKQKPNVGLTAKDAKRTEVEYLLTSMDYDDKQVLDNRTYKMKAFVLLDKMTDEDCRNYLTMTRPGGARGLSPDGIRKLVGDAAELNPKSFVEVMADDNKDMRVLVNELLNAGVLSRKGTQIMDGDIVVGFDIDQVMGHLSDPEHQPTLIRLQKELQRKKRAK